MIIDVQIATAGYGEVIFGVYYNNYVACMGGINDTCFDKHFA